MSSQRYVYSLLPLQQSNRSDPTTADSRSLETQPTDSLPVPMKSPTLSLSYNQTMLLRERTQTWVRHLRPVLNAGYVTMLWINTQTRRIGCSCLRIGRASGCPFLRSSCIGMRSWRGSRRREGSVRGCLRLHYRHRLRGKMNLLPFWEGRVWPESELGCLPGWAGTFPSDVDQRRDIQSPLPIYWVGMSVEGMGRNVANLYKHVVE